MAKIGKSKKKSVLSKEDEIALDKELDRMEKNLMGEGDITESVDAEWENMEKNLERWGI